MITKDNNGELSCAALPQVMRSSSDIRHVFLAQDVPACLNGLLDIDLANTKRRSELLSYLESSTPVSQKLSGLPCKRQGSSIFFFFLGLLPCNSVQRYFQESSMMFYSHRHLHIKFTYKYDELSETTMIT